MEQNRERLNYNLRELNGRRTGLAISNTLIEFQDGSSMCLKPDYGDRGTISFGINTPVTNQWEMNSYTRIRINKTVREITEGEPIMKSDIEILNNPYREEHIIYNGLEILLADFSNGVYTSRNTGGTRF